MIPRLVDISTERDTPLDVLREIRDVVPTAELVYVGHGRWWLGYVKAGPAMDIGYPPPNYARYQWDLQRQGFRWLGEYGDAFVTPGFLRRELEFMFGRTDRELERDFAHAEEVSSGVAKERQAAAALRDKAEADGRSIYAHVMRKRRSVLVP